MPAFTQEMPQRDGWPIFRDGWPTVLWTTARFCGLPRDGWPTKPWSL